MDILTSRENPTVKNLCKLLASKKARREQGLFVTEGIKLCLEAFRSGVLVKQIFYTPESLEKYPEEMKYLLCQSPHATPISAGVAQKISTASTPQGVFCLCNLLDNQKTLAKINSNGKYLALCSLQDPGNMGTVIRSAEAFGIDGLIVTGDCPDIYSPKVLRSTMGSAFRLPIAVTDDLQNLTVRMRAAGVSVYGAALSEDSVPLTGLHFDGGVLVLIGNEGNGLSAKEQALCDQKVIIPMKGRAESLNAAVAAAVFLWEMTK